MSPEEIRGIKKRNRLKLEDVHRAWVIYIKADIGSHIAFITWKHREAGTEIRILASLEQVVASKLKYGSNCIIACRGEVPYVDKRELDSILVKYYEPSLVYKPEELDGELL